MISDFYQNTNIGVYKEKCIVFLRHAHRRIFFGVCTRINTCKLFVWSPCCRHLYMWCITSAKMSFTSTTPSQHCSHWYVKTISGIHGTYHLFLKSSRLFDQLISNRQCDLESCLYKSRKHVSTALTSAVWFLNAQHYQISSVNPESYVYESENAVIWLWNIIYLSNWQWGP